MTSALGPTYVIFAGTAIVRALARPRRRPISGTPEALDLHLIADKYATHKHPAVKVWLAKLPHALDAYLEFLTNQVERFFSRITNDPIR
jgi:hypothetical protein